MTYLYVLLYTLDGYAGLVLLAETLIWRLQPAMDGGVTFTTEAVQGDEHEGLSKEYSMGFVLRLLCGFAPSRFLRLEPQS